MRWYALFLTAVVLLGCNEPLSFDQAMKLYNQKDYASAVTALSLLAEGGDYRAQLVLGQHFLQADSKDGAKSARYFKMAVDQGDIDALYFLGRAYLNGEGVPQNPIMGEEYLVRAGNAGSKAALVALGMRYSMMMNSSGSAEHGKKALVLFQNAFLYGDRAAAVLISSIYTGGPLNNRYLSAVWNAVYQMTETKPSDIDPFRYLTPNEKNSANLEALAIYSKFGSKQAPKTYLGVSGA